MTGIIVSGHGNFASGITSSLYLIMGEQEHYTYVDFPKGDTNTELVSNMKKAIESFRDFEHILIFTDLISGSPFNAAIMEAMKDARIKVIYGTNLGMLMESVLKRNMGVSFEKLLEGAIETGKAQVGLFSPIEDEEDDF